MNSVPACLLYSFRWTFLIRLPQDVDPVLRKLKLHDISGVEVDADVFAVKQIDEAVHFLRAEEEAVGEDVFQVEVDAGLLGNLRGGE